MVANQYAEALFLLALENKKINDYKEELEAVSEVLKKEKDFEKLLLSPSLKPKDKNNVIEKVFNKLDKNIISFLCILANNNRINEFESILIGYTSISSKNSDVAYVTVETKENLTKEINIKVKTTIEKKLNKKVILEEKINENIKGGIKVSYNGKLIDITVDSQIDKLKNFI